MATPWILVRRHLRVHWLRTGLTVAALVLALFLFCFLISIVTSLRDTAKQAATNRIIVASEVSLYVDLPRDYQPKIVQVPGVEEVSKFQWFGGIYQDPSNFFAQFGIEPEPFFRMYERDFEIVEGPGGVKGEAARAAVLQALAADRRAALIGAGLARDRRFHFKVGDTVPLLGTIFHKADGSAWDFNVVGIYKPKKSNFDDRTLFFRYDYLAETLDAELASGPRGVGTYSVSVAPGHDPARVIEDIDALFASGPQRTRTTTEAAFNAGFISMWGNLPMFLGTIGGAVVFAVFFTVVNVMLMSARQRLHESGILKALGFSDAAMVRLTLGESLLVSLLGGGGGIAVAYALSFPLRVFLGQYMPTFAIAPQTMAWGVAVTLVIGLIAGLGPALLLFRLRPTEALRSEG